MADTQVQVPGFKILEELGRGAMGVVHLAHEEAVGRRVALKILRAGVASDPEVRARFEREVRATGRLRHPCIVPVLSTGETAGHLWYAMQYVPATSLDRVLEAAPGDRLAPSRAARIVRALADALDAAHEAGVTHRDVKPGNVLLLTEPVPAHEAQTAGRRERSSWRTGNGDGREVDRPLLVDFGLAMDRTAAKLSLSGMLIGTPGYMSPEQLEGRAEDVGPASDQWALGVMLYECLTGRMPFPTSDLHTLARFVRQERPISPSRLDPLIDRDLETIVLKCLEKKPSDRYPSCHALAEDLGRWLREEPITARPPGAVRRVRAWARRRPVQATLFTAALVAAVATGAALWGLERGRAARVTTLTAEGRAAIEQGEFETAERLLGEAIALEPGSTEARDLQASAEAGRRLRRAEALFAEAQALMAEEEAGTRALGLLADRARRGRLAAGGAGLGLEEAWGSEPRWMRQPAYRARRTLETERGRLTRLRAEIEAGLAAALSLAEVSAPRAGPRGTPVLAEIREGVAAWHASLWRRASERGDAETAVHHRERVEQLAPERYRDDLDGRAEVTLLPADVPARAWLYRYREEAAVVDGGTPRFIPLPSSPRGETIVPETYAESVRARLEGAGTEPLAPHVPSVTEPFRGSERSVGTMVGPLRRDRYEALRRSTAYPLVQDAHAALGTLDARRTVSLPEGRYLLLLGAEGRVSVRLPFEVRDRRPLTLDPGRLPEPGEVPEGFAWISGGVVAMETEGNASVERLTEVAPFLGARFEVTYEDWWDFLNDPRTLEEIERHREQGLRFVPRVEGEPIPAWEPGPPGYWRELENAERPVADISLYDVVGYIDPPAGETEPGDADYQALADSLRSRDTATLGWGYLRWRTERSARRAVAARPGEATPEDVIVRPGPDGAPAFVPLAFTLPTGAEWVRMARGGDRRVFVYGDEREWLFFKGRRSRPTNAASEPVGLFVEDESVFGVRDLTGSVSEWTADWKQVGGLFGVRGHAWGSLGTDDDRIDHTAWLAPQPARATVGLRVVVRP